MDTTPGTFELHGTDGAARAGVLVLLYIRE